MSLVWLPLALMMLALFCCSSADPGRRPLPEKYDTGFHTSYYYLLTNEDGGRFNTDKTRLSMKSVLARRLDEGRAFSETKDREVEGKMAVKIGLKKEDRPVPAKSMWEVEARRVRRQVDFPSVEITPPASEDVQTLMDQLTTLTNRVSAMDFVTNFKFEQLESRLDAAQACVAFHAHSLTDPFTIPGLGTAVYNSAATNIGDAYDVETGIFTAPFTGIYVFFINCMASEVPGELLELKANSETVASCLSALRGPEDPIEQGSAMATVHLQANQTVSVCSTFPLDHHIRGALYSTFAGLLVRADSV